MYHFSKNVQFLKFKKIIMVTTLKIFKNLCDANFNFQCGKIFHPICK
jgi:hypothetical protein